MRHVIRSGGWLTMLLLATSPVTSQEIQQPSGDTIVEPGARLERLYTRTATIRGGLTEGPAVAPDGSIYFTDIPVGDDGGMIVRFDPHSRSCAAFSIDSGKANGLIFDADGFLLACEGSDRGGRRVSRWNVRTGERQTVVDRLGGKRFNAPNDLCLDRDGRIFFTDPRYLGDEPRELEHRAVYCIERDGKVREVTHEISKPNGIGISPDGKWLYVADHDNGTDKIDPTKPTPPQGPMKIYGFPLTPDGHVQGERRTVWDFGNDKGCDGMTLDRHGNLYLTWRSLNRPGVLVISPDGEEVGFIPTGPANQTVDEQHPAVGLPSNVEFGIGDESNMLYVTVDLSLYRIRLKSEGHHVQYPR